MTNKDQLIQEMASDMNYATVKHDLWPDDAKEIAKTLILLGYGKLPEGVTLSSKQCAEIVQDNYNIGYERGKTEMAEKIIKLVYSTLTDEEVWSKWKKWWLRNGECEELKKLLYELVNQCYIETHGEVKKKNKEMLQCCRDCSYPCKQYDDLTEPCGCCVADINYFNKVFKLYDDNKEEV